VPTKAIPPTTKAPPSQTHLSFSYVVLYQGFPHIFVLLSGQGNKVIMYMAFSSKENAPEILVYKIPPDITYSLSSSKSTFPLRNKHKGEFHETFINFPGFEILR
jgi:hypothetical protein